MIKALVLSPFVSQKMATFVAKPNARDLELLTERIEAGELKPVIDRTYSLDELREAMQYLETGRARGKVVVTVRA